MRKLYLCGFQVLNLFADMINKRDRRIRIKRSIRQKLSGSATRPRVSVFKSNQGIYVQFIDDEKGCTLLAGTTRTTEKKKNANVQDARQLGEQIGEQALEKGIQNIVFDRNGYIYHGKVRAVAEGLREKGLVF